MKRLIGLIFCVLCINTFAQTSDLELIKEHVYDNKQSKRNVKFGITNSNNIIAKYNPISLIFGGLMFTYQKYISQQTNSNCPYSPSCSEYGKQLIKKYGVVKGIPCAADRLLRCNPSSVSLLRWKVDPQDGHIHEKTEYYQFKP